MKLTKEELSTLKSALQIAKVHVSNDLVCTKYADVESSQIDFLEEILNLQKRINTILDKIEGGDFR